MKYIKGLDSLRAFAVIFVVIGHSRIMTFANGGHPVSKIFQLLLPSNTFGVDIFFVLSGFLITSVLLHARNGGRQRIVIAGNFLARRVLRIFPVYYLTIIILWFIQYPDIHRYLGWFLTYTSNILSFRTRDWNAFSHSWTLSVEEQFYLIWPWLMLYTKEKYFKYLFAAFILTGPVSSFITMQLNNGFAPILAPNCFDGFGIGGLYAYCSLSPERLKKFKRVLRNAFPVALGIYLYWKLLELIGYPGLYESSFSRTINSVIAIWLIDQVIYSKSVFWEHPLLNSIGKVSYGIYLFHIPVSVIINSMDIQASVFLIYAIKLSALLGISYLSYYYFELKLMALKSRFRLYG
jgi:peptidoglycan/LPS O-acetylase OafA/YrhL